MTTPHSVRADSSNFAVPLGSNPARSVHWAGDMGIDVPGASHLAPRPVAVWILGILSAMHGAAAFVLVAGGRTSANELAGFLPGVAASVLLVGAVLSYGLVRLRAELRNTTPAR